MRARTRLRKMDVTPAPNNYAISTTVGEAPKYSMTARSKIGGFAEGTLPSKMRYSTLLHYALPLLILLLLDMVLTMYLACRYG
jgi:hypothetical protein